MSVGQLVRSSSWNHREYVGVTFPVQATSWRCGIWTSFGRRWSVVWCQDVCRVLSYLALFSSQSSASFSFKNHPSSLERTTPRIEVKATMTKRSNFLTFRSDHVRVCRQFMIYKPVLRWYYWYTEPINKKEVPYFTLIERVQENKKNTPNKAFFKIFRNSFNLDQSQVYK